MIWLIAILFIVQSALIALCWSMARKVFAPKKKREGKSNKELTDCFVVTSSHIGMLSKRVSDLAELHDAGLAPLFAECKRIENLADGYHSEMIELSSRIEKIEDQFGSKLSRLELAVGMTMKRVGAGD
jgi:hypothetical protein